MRRRRRRRDKLTAARMRRDYDLLIVRRVKAAANSPRNAAVAPQSNARSKLERCAIERIFFDQALQRAPVFPGGFGRLGDIPLVARQQIGDVAAFEFADPERFRPTKKFMAEEVF